MRSNRKNKVKCECNQKGKQKLNVNAIKKENKSE